MTNHEETTGPHRTRKSGEWTVFDAIDEITSSLKKMQNQIHSIDTRIASSVHLEETVRSQARELKDQAAQVIALNIKMGGVMWFAGVCGVACVGSVIAAIVAILSKGHP